jgi:hypothetical protein
MSEQQPETLLEFPCEYAVKAMGITSDELEIAVIDIVKRHVETLAENAVSLKQSSGGKYTSVTIKFTATSKQQLDAIYQELSHHSLIKYAL